MFARIPLRCKGNFVPTSFPGKKNEIALPNKYSTLVFKAVLSVDRGINYGVLDRLVNQAQTSISGQFICIVNAK